MNEKIFDEGFGPGFQHPEKTITLRDFFAGMALVGATTREICDYKSEDQISKYCFGIADAMIEERSKS